MKYAAVIEYHPDRELVSRHRPDHRAYLQQLLADGKLVASGPFADGSGALIIYEAETAAAAEALIQADPFRSAGVFVRWNLSPWEVVFFRREAFPA